MTPQEKAQELFNKLFRNIMGYGPRERETAKQCALIAIDQMKESLYNNDLMNMYDYWLEVKKEINKL